MMPPEVSIVYNIALALTAAVACYYVYGIISESDWDWPDDDDYGLDEDE